MSATNPHPEELLVARRFRVVRHYRQARDGSQQGYEIVHHPGAVAILPILDDGKVCLIRNFRVSVNRQLVELPAGTLEPGENPDVTAARELAEETGYRAARITKLCEFYLSPGILNERMHLYLATGLVLGETALEAGETIERLIVRWDEALAMALDGTIEDAKSLVGILVYDRLRLSAATSQS